MNDLDPLIALVGFALLVVLTGLVFDHCGAATGPLTYLPN